jgi:glutaredoxin 2
MFAKEDSRNLAEALDVVRSRRPVDENTLERLEAAQADVRAVDQQDSSRIDDLKLDTRTLLGV